MGKFCQISKELLPLKFMLVLDLGHYSINFLETLHVIRYYEGVLLDCISFIF